MQQDKERFDGMKSRFWLTAVVGATIAVAAALPAHADWRRIDAYSEITSQSGVDGYKKTDGCGSGSSASGNQSSQGHIGVRTYFKYRWYDPDTVADGYWAFDLTGSIYGFVSASGSYMSGGDGFSGSGVASLINGSCSANSTYTTPGNTNYIPNSATANFTTYAEGAVGSILLLDCSNYSDSYASASSSPSASPQGSVTAISSTDITIHNLQRVP